MDLWGEWRDSVGLPNNTTPTGIKARLDQIILSRGKSCEPNLAAVADPRGGGLRGLQPPSPIPDDVIPI